jgi:protein pelota
MKEVLNSTELKKVLSNVRSSHETSIVEELLKNIAKDNFATYGFHETQYASDRCSIKDLLLTGKYIQKMREEGHFNSVEKIIKNTEITKGEVHIISSEHEAGKKLDGLGGIGAITRF